MPGSSAGAVSDGTPAAGAATPRILIVEDDFFVSLDVERWVREAGFDVVGVAASAEEALAIARQSRPDLAVIDIRILGPKDGVEAAIELYAELGVRAVFASAHSDSSTRGRAKPAEPLGWLTKPYSSRELTDLLRSALAAR